MEKSTAKMFLSIFIISSIFWLGAGCFRAVIGNELLQFGTIELKPNIDPIVERTIFDFLAHCSLFSLIAYPISTLSAIGYIMTTEISMKENGWLLMCAILFFMFIPVEAYCLTLDWKLVGLNYWGNWPLEEFQKAFFKRLTALAGLPFIATLCYYTIIIVAIWQPMKNKIEKEI